jgi:oleate hydratase
VYQLLKVQRAVPPVTRHDHSPKVLLDSLVKSFS